MFDQIVEVAKGKQIVMFLDYDGTLSPIVKDPESAFMSEAVLFLKLKFSISTLPSQFEVKFIFLLSLRCEMLLGVLHLVSLLPLYLGDAEKR